MKVHRGLLCAVLLGWSLLAATEVRAESQVVTVAPAPVQVSIRSDDPRLGFVIILPSPIDPEYDQVLWQADGSSRVSLFPGQYRLRTVTRTSYIERDLKIVDDAELEVVSPSSSARAWGLGTGIAGSIVAGVSAFVLFAAAWGLAAGDCFEPDCRQRGLTDREKVYAGALLGAVVVGGTVGALGFRAYFRNRYPRVTMVAREAKSPAKPLSFGPARLGDAWGLAGAGTSDGD